MISELVLVTSALSANPVISARVQHALQGKAVGQSSGHEEPLTEDSHIPELPDVLKRLRRQAGNPSLRRLVSMLKRNGEDVSMTTLWRAFEGKGLPSMRTLRAILTALRPSDEDTKLCLSVWEAAYDGAASLRASRRKGSSSPTSPQDDDGSGIYIHGGSVHIEDRAATKGRTIVIHGGNVYLSSEAAAAASEIIIHDGNVFVAALPETSSKIIEDIGHPSDLGQAERDAGHEILRNATHISCVQ